MATLIGHITAIVGALADVHTSQKNALGVRAFDTSGNEFVYLKGVASTVIGSIVTFNPSTGATALSVTGAKGPVAVAMAAVVAGNFGWYQIYGAGQGNFAGAAVASAKLYSAGTGTCDDAVVAGDQIVGATVGATVSGAGLGSVFLVYPCMQGLG